MPLDQTRHPFAVPIIDLNDETDRQVVVDREPGQYLGHPTTVLMEDGRTMWAVYPKGHGKGAIVMKKSPDAGLTWSDRLPVPENWATSREVPTLYRVEDPEGGRRLIMFSGLYPVRMAVSEDDGQTWTPLQPIGDWGGVVAMSDLIYRGNGEYLALFHDDGRFLHGGPNQVKGSPAAESVQYIVYKSRSTDGGLTWGQPEELTTRPDLDLCEPGVVRSPDGSRLAVLLRESSRQRNSFIIFSDDEGQSWSAPRELPLELTGDRHQAVYAPDGRLFISFRDMGQGSPTHGDWVGSVCTFSDLENGKPGQYRIRLKENHVGGDCAYPALDVSHGGTIICTTYGHWEEGEEPYILNVRFTLPEIDEKAEDQSG